MADHAAQLLRAWDAPNARSAERPASAIAVRYGNAWWSYAETDQLAAALALQDPQGWRSSDRYRVIPRGTRCA